MSFAEFIYTEVLKPKPLKTLTNAILLRILPERLRVGPAVMHLDLSDPVVSGALTLRVFEPSELAFFQKYCRGDMTLVDIGANIGLYSALAIHALTPTGRVVALEPHPVTFAFLRRNVEANLSLRGKEAPQVDVFQLAAAPRPGIQSLRLNPENRGDNRLYRGTYQGRLEEWDSIPVEGQPLDALLARLGMREVNFVKMDIQGYEGQAIAGFKETLARSRRVILMSEYWPKGLREAGGDALPAPRGEAPRPRRERLAAWRAVALAARPGSTSKDEAHGYLQDLTDLGFTLYELKERPRGKVVPLEDWERLIARLPGRKYANIIGVKGVEL